MRCVATQKIGPPSSASVPQKVRKYSIQLVRPVAAVRQQAVIRHADAQHAGHEVEDDGGEDGAGVDEEERGNRADMEGGHRDGGDAVDALLVPAPVHQGRGRHGRCDSSESR